MRLAVILTALVSVGLFVASSSAAPQPSKRVQIFVVVPSSYTSPVTPDQAFAATLAYFGTPADAPCLSAVPMCSIEGYFRSQLGKVFDYDITVVPGALPQPESGRGTDECGQGGIEDYWWRPPILGYTITDNRTLDVVLGGGGWAGHNPGSRQEGSFGMIGDWGIQRRFGVALPCVPEWIAAPNGQGMDRGFAHEFEGMMGAFRHGATYDYFCCERPYEAQHRRNVLQWSRDWLRDP